ncbi:MAG: hypothetical protein E6767_01385 [Dysgonomonas sp.]|nr:hypothetical protein [Dysgonomonas sp.]
MNYTKELIILILISVITLNSCNNKKKQQEVIATEKTETKENQALNIPDKVEVKKDNGQIQLPGTHIFVSKPEGFTLFPEMIRLQKSDDNYIHFVESFGMSYYEKRPEVLQAFENAQQQHGLTPYYQKEFKLGDYDAFIIYGADNVPNLDQIVMLFGDDDFSVMIACALIRSDNKSKQQIVDALQTIYVDKSAKVDYDALSNFAIDLSKTKFKFNRHMSSVFYYTIDGKGDPLSDLYLDQIMIMPLPAVTYEKKVELVEDMLPRYAQSGVIITSEIDRKEIEINNMRGYEASFDANYVDKPAQIYVLVVGDNKATISFSGMSFNNRSDIFEQIKKVAKTLKSK